MAAIHIGDYHNSQGGATGGGLTLLLTGAPTIATGTGLINTLYAYWYSYLADTVYFGIFYLVSGTTYTCRSAANFAIGGSGLRSYVSNLQVNAGDFLGIYFAAGTSQLCWGTYGAGYSYRTVSSYNACVAGNTTNFPQSGTSRGSLDGTGVTPSFIPAYNTGGILAGKRLARGMGWFERLDGLVVPRGGVLVPSLNGGSN